MAYNHTSNLQNTTDGNNPIIYAVGPDGKPNIPGVGTTMMTFNNPPTTVVTNASPQSEPGCCSREFAFAILSVLLAIAGGVMWGVSAKN
ncbi:7221_t:CDS:2 [Paraglomus occultum]|uniref:7221_t:CDS:1 n=1 Tax=Paraglomus occultum TaxID=144539 RepID=A0A9N9G0Q9_9GLOM|nr:7221_t:CDS:2 [Paraglomus occultum]